MSLLTAYPPNISWNGTEYGVAWINVQLSAQGQILGNYLRLVTLNASGVVTSDRLIQQEDGQAGVTWTGSVNGWTFFPSHTATANVSVSGAQIYFNTPTFSEPVSALAGQNTYPFMIWTGDRYAVVWMNVQNNQLQIYFGAKNATSASFTPAN